MYQDLQCDKDLIISGTEKDIAKEGSQSENQNWRNTAQDHVCKYHIIQSSVQSGIIANLRVGQAGCVFLKNPQEQRCYFVPGMKNLSFCLLRTSWTENSQHSLLFKMLNEVIVCTKT